MNNLIWFLVGCWKMYLMWCFVWWQFPLPLGDMESPQRVFFLLLTLIWGVEFVLIRKLYRDSKEL